MVSMVPRVINAYNVNDALYLGLMLLDTFGIEQESRNGTVLVSPSPVTTYYARPTERVLFNAWRDANPFFHLFEALWMLRGRNDVKFVERYNRRMKEYSDNGVYLNGAYGYRWRYNFGYDQLDNVIDELKKDPKSRRVVVTMFDPSYEGDWIDIAQGSKDVPCNTHIYFSILDGKLNMTVCCRSNDIWWGAYGANMVHFSILQEYLAAHIGCGVGAYYQMSNNYHLYKNVVDMNNFRLKCPIDDRYAPDEHEQAATVLPLVKNPKQFDEELNRFMGDTLRTDYQEPFFKRVVVPMHQAWEAKMELGGRQGNITALSIIKDIARAEEPFNDWLMATTDWLWRRINNREQGHDSR